MNRTLSQLAIVAAGAALLSMSAACTVHEDRGYSRRYDHDERYDHRDDHPEARRDYHPEHDDAIRVDVH